ncbi:unnamed protein product [Pieris brassicae]|uniref:Uncharacterized protein n=1 Tax=Pieris brassicae TaxID=7116 RepID=A0A9P0SDC2_PIEBR|nr:unnamed protein product [Pieris brassicae]
MPDTPESPRRDLRSIQLAYRSTIRYFDWEPIYGQNAQTYASSDTRRCQRRLFAPLSYRPISTSRSFNSIGRLALAQVVPNCCSNSPHDRHRN